MHAEIASASDKIVNHRPVQELEPSRAAGFPDHDLSDIVRARVVDHIIRNAAAPGKGDCDAAEPLGKTQRIGDTIAFHLRKILAPQRLDIERRPGRAQPVRDPLRIADESGAVRVLADAHEDALTGGQRPIAHPYA